MGAIRCGRGFAHPCYPQKGIAAGRQWFFFEENHPLAFDHQEEGARLIISKRSPQGWDPADRGSLGREGYRLLQNDSGATWIAADTDIGLLYGTFKWLQMTQAGAGIPAAGFHSEPKIQRRIPEPLGQPEPARWKGVMPGHPSGTGIACRIDIDLNSNTHRIPMPTGNSRWDQMESWVNNVNRQLPRVIRHARSHRKCLEESAA